MKTPEPPQETFLPDLCGIRPLFAVVIIGELLVFVLVVVRAGVGAVALRELALLSLYVQLIGMSAAAALCLSRRALARLPERWAAGLSYVLVMLMSAVVCAAATLIIYPAGGEVALIALERRDFWLRTLSIAAIVGALVLRYFYVQHQWKQRTAAEAAARLQALQARIRPHFLFNSMNSIAALVRRDPAAAEQAVEDLSELFRAALGQGVGADTLAGEIHLAQRFLGIEQLRLGDRLRVRWDSAPDLPLDLSMPRLVLQPLLENAVVHGVARLPEGGEITVALRVEGGRLRVEVANPYPVDVPGRPGNGHALASIRQRLEHRFGRGVGMTASAERGYYRVRLDLPMPAA